MKWLVLLAFAALILPPLIWVLWRSRAPEPEKPAEPARAREGAGRATARVGQDGQGRLGIGSAPRSSGGGPSGPESA